MKIGALLPRSVFQPLLQHNFQQGLQAYLQYRQLPLELIMGNIGFGTEPELMQAQAEKMLLEQQADVLLMYADQEYVQPIAELARQLNRLVLLVHNSAKYKHAWEPHPNVLSNTLNNTIQCRLTGAYAAGLANNAAICTSFYDGGYSHCHALTQSYTDSGGSVVYNFVSQYKAEEFNAAPLHDFLGANTQVQALLALYNGQLAHLFLQQFQQAAIAKDIQVFASPMMLDETLPAVYGELALPFRISAYVPWVSSLDNDANRLLKSQFLSFSGREANLAAMHGWDTAMILEHIFNTADGHRFRAREILAGLSDVKFSSPRGPLHMDAATHHMIAPAWLVQTNEMLEPIVSGSVEDTAPIWHEIINDKTIIPGTGWFNTYLCA